MVAVDEENEEILNLVCHCLPGVMLNKWKSVEIPEMLSI